MPAPGGNLGGDVGSLLHNPMPVRILMAGNMVQQPGTTPLAPTIWVGVGVPSNAIGVQGDYYFRADPAGATHMYFRGIGWTAFV